MTPTEKDDLIAELKNSLAMAQQRKTLRDEFAISALNRVLVSNGWPLQVDQLAQYSYMLADAMMKERHK
jgi:hypothetical protein